MIDHYLRSTKDTLLDFIASPLYRISPTSLSLIGLICGLLAGLLLLNQYYWLGFVFWLLNRLFDGLDGTVARKNQQQTDFGGYLDILFDFTIYAVIPLALVISRPTLMAYLSLSILLGSFYINSASWMFLSAILEKRKHGSKAKGELTTVTMPSGLIGGAETVIFYSLFILWPAFIVPLFLLMSMLVFLTIAQRLHWAKQHLT